MQTKEDLKLFFSLVIWMLIPSIYLAVRMHIVTVNDVNVNILGQMEWFDLIDEMLITTLITPLYVLLEERKASMNGFAFCMSCGIYMVFSLIVSIYVGNIAEFMHAEYAEQFLAMQPVSMVVRFTGTFCILLFTMNDAYKTIVVLTVSRFVLAGIGDFILIGRYGDLGAVYSDIITNGMVSVAALACAVRGGLIRPGRPDRAFAVSWLRIGLFAGMQIFLDNFIYAVLVCRMVNAVSESGNYWVANNFIWGWMLIPVSCFVQIIQKNRLGAMTWKNSMRYILLFCSLWFVTMPFWKVFLTYGMGVKDAADVLQILRFMVPFYVCYAVSACIDGWFVSYGKTVYILINSAVVNIGFYGILYVLFRRNVFPGSMIFIEMLFGTGMVVHLAISLMLYMNEMRKQFHHTGF